MISRLVGLRSMLSKDVIVSSLTQLWRLVSGPISMLLIPLFLTADIQGFWYTFGSISALSIFADLGFTTIIMQFSSHQFAFLEFDRGFDVKGPDEYVGSLASLFRFVMKWNGILTAVVFPLIFAIGFFMFSAKAAAGVWLLPWCLFSVASAMGFMNSAVSSFIMGCDQVANIQKGALAMSIVSTAVLAASLLAKLSLLAIGVTQIASQTVFSAFMLVKYRKFFTRMLKARGGGHKWGKEVFALLWKYALSWSSGYLIFQIYTPLMFQYHGAAEAGKVGITISLVTAMFNLSNTWFTVNTPRLNMLVAKKEWRTLDSFFLKNLVMTVATYLVGVLVLLGAVLAFSGRIAFFDRISARFLGIAPLATLIICWFLQILVNSLAVYLRAHKQEPLVVPSVVGGVFIAITTLLCAKYLPSSLFFSGFLASFAFGIPWALAIFLTKRKVWHQWDAA